MFDPARPSTELDWFSLVDGRAGRVIDPARPSAELDWFSSADGRAGRVVDPARPSAEQVAWSIQLGGWQNRSFGGSSSAIRRAGRWQDLGLITALGGAMTSSTYVSRIVFDLISSRFKVRDMFSAYVTYVSRCFKSLVLTLRRRNIFWFVCDRGIRTEGLAWHEGCVHSDSQGCSRSRIRPWYIRVNIKGQRALVEIDRPSLPELSVLRWPIVREKDFSALVRSQLRDDCLLGCDRGERNAEATFRNSQGRPRDAKDDQADSPGDEDLVTDQGVRGRMDQAERSSIERVNQEIELPVRVHL
uniref:Uncharacterized protein n=1 Tax=Brassica oleracea var. oleracea TaxID=109376 RepID=A0A0D3DKG8_BRAOL